MDEYESKIIQTLEDERDQLQARIAELEAERDRAVERHSDLVAVHMDVMNKLGNSTHELAECRAMNAALVAASGQGVRMETLLTSGETLYDANAEIKAREYAGWQYDELILQHNGHWAIVMQRPARPESEGITDPMQAFFDNNPKVSEGSDNIQKAIEMLQDGGDLDGSHHKQWYIDQTLRLLMGKEAYEKWWKEYATEYGGWDEGIAP
jgi:hypothetical protein